MSATIYIPDLFKALVTKVDATFSAATADPFHVYFDYGHLNEVTKNLQIKANSITQKTARYPLIWLVMDFEEAKGKTPGIYAELTASLVIAVPTLKEYSMEQRKTAVFLKRLYPIYGELLKQFNKSAVFGMPPVARIPHTKIDRPYWGGQDKSGDANLFNDMVDAIQIKNLKLFVRS